MDSSSVQAVLASGAIEELTDRDRIQANCPFEASSLIFSARRVLDYDERLSLADPMLRGRSEQRLTLRSEGSCLPSGSASEEVHAGRSADFHE